MGLLINNCQGHVYVLTVGSAGGQDGGFYSLEPALPDNVLITSMPLGFIEVMQPVLTLDDKRILYTYGSAWNQLSVACKILLGPSSEGGKLIADVSKYYKNNRLSESSEPIGISMGTAGVDAYLIGMAFGASDPNLNTLDFNLQFVTPDVNT